MDSWTQSGRPQAARGEARPSAQPETSRAPSPDGAAAGRRGTGGSPRRELPSPPGVMAGPTPAPRRFPEPCRVPGTEAGLVLPVCSGPQEAFASDPRGPQGPRGVMGARRGRRVAGWGRRPGASPLSPGVFKESSGAGWETLPRGQVLKISLKINKHLFSWERSANRHRYEVM